MHHWKFWGGKAGRKEKSQYFANNLERWLVTISRDALESWRLFSHASSEKSTGPVFLSRFSFRIPRESLLLRLNLSEMNIVDYDSMGTRYQQGGRSSNSAASHASSATPIQRQNISYVSLQKFTRSQLPPPIFSGATILLFTEICLHCSVLWNELKQNYRTLTVTRLLLTIYPTEDECSDQSLARRSSCCSQHGYSVQSEQLHLFSRWTVRTRLIKHKSFILNIWN